MTLIPFLAFMIADSSDPTVSPAPLSDYIKVSQVGYVPTEPKFALVTGGTAEKATIRNAASGRAVLSTAIGPAVSDPDTGDTVRAVDFSSVKKEGTYFVEVLGLGQSYRFRIGRDILVRPFRLAMRSFTGQRCGTKADLSPDYPQYRYDACHLQPGQYHSSSGREGTRDVSGGWHDAGDYGKYIVNSGITTGTLLWAYELNPRKLSRVNLDIPESGGKIPDVLAEIKWNLDWMLKMQDEDGGVWHKATTANFPGFVMPADDKAPVLVIGTGTPPYKNTTATADFAAVCAIAGRVYRPFDRAYANRCLDAAEKAYRWLQANPDHNFVRNPNGIATGGYGDRDPGDERLWAAAELFRTTGKRLYHDDFLRRYSKWSPTVNPDSPPGWPNVQSLAMITYALTARKTADGVVVGKIKADTVRAADAIVARARGNGYRIPLKSTEYYWGSNSVVANYALILSLADRFRPNADYRNARQDALHYLFGRNTFNTSYVTHVGSRWAMNPHHRPSGADKIEQPWPGLLVGGPNADGKTPPARQWLDQAKSYTTNENAINWNAALVFVLAEAL